MKHDNKQDVWFKKFMGMPVSGSKCWKEVELWIGIFLAIALIVAVVMVKS